MGLSDVKKKKKFQAETALNDLRDAEAAVRMGMVDTVSTYINKGYYLQFSRIADSDFSVNFFAFMESFSDSYSSNFQQDPAFGRTDPLPYYQNTQRSIAMNWTLVAHNMESAAKNLNDVKGLIQMLYPSYTAHGNQNTFSGAPIIGLKYINLARGSGGGESGEVLAGTISSFTHTPDLEFGVFEETGGILPKVIRLTCTFSPIHSKTLGFDGAGNSLSGKNFPYRNFGLGKYNPGDPSDVKFDQQYLDRFKEGTAGEREIEPDTAYSTVIQAREDAILESSSESSNPWEKLFGSN